MLRTVGKLANVWSGFGVLRFLVWVGFQNNST